MTKQGLIIKANWRASTLKCTGLWTQQTRGQRNWYAAHLKYCLTPTTAQLWHKIENYINNVSQRSKSFTFSIIWSSFWSNMTNVITLSIYQINNYKFHRRSIRKYGIYSVNKFLSIIWTGNLTFDHILLTLFSVISPGPKKIYI